MLCDESSLYSRINYVHSSDLNFAGVSGIIKTSAQVTSAHTVLHYANAPALDMEEPDVMIYVERFVKCSEQAFSK